MPAGQLFINNRDAYTAWGISLSTDGLSALMTPTSIKTFVSDDCRLKNGTDYIVDNIRVTERYITLPLVMSAPTEKAFFNQHSMFCQELKKVQLNVKTSFQSGVVYKCLYQSCTQYAQYMRGIAKFTLKLIEPNPTDRNE